MPHRAADCKEQSFVLPLFLLTLLSSVTFRVFLHVFKSSARQKNRPLVWEIFKGAQYLYSTPDSDGDPNIYRWNYFYTPVKIGDEVAGVRIAVRDMVRQTDGAMDSQIYNWGIKRDASLDGGERGSMPDRSGVSSDAPGSIPLDGGGSRQSPLSPGVSSGVTSINSIPQPPTGVNLQRSLPGGIPADIPPGLRKLYRLAQEMSTKPQPREIPYRPVQPSPQEILTQLAQGMARDSLQGGPLADRSDADIIAMLDEIARRQGRIDKTGNPIENSGQYDILEETGYSIQPITEESIQKVALVQPHGLSKVQAKQLQDAHKKLLHSVMGKPAGTEAYALYSADMSAEIDGGIGEEDGQSVSIPRCTIPHIAIQKTRGRFFCLDDFSER